MLFDPEDNEVMLLVTDEGPRHPPQRLAVGLAPIHLHQLLNYTLQNQQTTKNDPRLSESHLL